MVAAEQVVPVTTEVDSHASMVPCNDADIDATGGMSVRNNSSLLPQAASLPHATLSELASPMNSLRSLLPLPEHWQSLIA